MKLSVKSWRGFYPSHKMCDLILCIVIRVMSLFDWNKLYISLLQGNRYSIHGLTQDQDTLLNVLNALRKKIYIDEPSSIKAYA